MRPGGWARGGCEACRSCGGCGGVGGIERDGGGPSGVDGCGGGNGGDSGRVIDAISSTISVKYQEWILLETYCDSGRMKLVISQ